MFKRFKVLTRLNSWALGIVLSGVIVTGLMSMLIVLLQGPAIEKELIGNVSEFLQDQGFERVNVHANGRDIVLRGKVSSDAAESTALGYVRSVNGVRMVGSDLGFMPLRLPHVLIIRGLDHELSVEGEVSSAESAKQLFDLIVSKIEHTDVNQLIEFSPEVIDPHWISVLPAILDEVNQFESLEIEIGAGQAMIGGLIKDKSNYQVVFQRLSQFLENANIELVNGIGIVPTGFYAGIEAFLVAEDVSAKKIKTEEEPPVVENMEGPGVTVIDLPEELALEGDVSETEETRVEIADFKASEQDPEQETIAEKGVVAENPAEIEAELLTIEQCQRRLNEIMISYPVTFSKNRVDLPVENTITIEKIVEIYELCPPASLTVRGHTDSSGKPEVNLRLSQLRAESVVQNLVVAGFPESRVKAIGFGASSPVADNNSEEGRRKNRRIELRIN